MMQNGRLIVVIVLVFSPLLKTRMADCQPTVEFSNSADDEEWRLQMEEEIERLQLDLESERNRIKVLEKQLGESFCTTESVMSKSTQPTTRPTVHGESVENLVSATTSVSTTHRASATANIVKGIDNSCLSVRGVGKLEDKIYILCYKPNKVRVFADDEEFSFLREISIAEISRPFAIVGSNASKCLYIDDRDNKCIWKMTTTDDNRLTKWLTNVTWPFVLSVDNVGRPLILRCHMLPCQLEIYNLNGLLNRHLQLPQNFNQPEHAIQTMDGHFIVVHWLGFPNSGRWVISQLTSDGHVTRQFSPRDESQELGEQCHLAINSEGNQLFVADYWKDRVIVLDARSLRWHQVLLTRQDDGIKYPWRLNYDGTKKHLIVGQNSGEVFIYSLNI